MTAQINARLRSRIVISTRLAITLLAALPAVVLAHPPSPC
jgi:hypothetical protein